MDDILSRLERLPPRKWGLHETVLCQELGIKAKDNLSVRSQLTKVVVALAKGRYRLKPDDPWTKTKYLIMDLSETSIANYFDIHYYKQGEKEGFATDSLKEASVAMHQPRYFTIGGSKANEKGQIFDRIRTQCLIMKFATGQGNTNGLDEVSRLRRQAHWLPWYENRNDKTKEYERKDLPVLAIQFRDFWDVTIPKDEQGRIPVRLLTAVAEEIRKILRCCNRIPRRTRSGTSIVDQQQAVVVVSPTNKRPRPQEDDTTEDSTKKLCPSQSRELPESLTLTTLRDLINDGHLEELAAIEFAVHLLYTEKVSVTVAADSFQQAGVRNPNSISVDDLHKLPKRLHPWVIRNVSVARKELIDGSGGGLFCPEKGDMLHAWIADGKRYTNGERLPAMNYEMHPVSNQMCLTDKAAHYIRNMVYCHKIPRIRFPSLWNAFALLMIGRPLTQQEFSSSATLRYRFQRLYMIDKYRFHAEFEKYITARHEKGFHRLWYMVTDDSKHHDRDRHVCLMTAHRADDPSDTNASPNPCFRLLTASVAPSKDSDGNASLNVSAASDSLSISVLALYAGAVTDNAPDALDETRKTFDRFMELVKDNDQVSSMGLMYGVQRRPIINGDMYHIDNLMCTHASNASFGETERGDHSQVHHRQLLQSLHDVHKKDRAASRRAMATVLEGTGNKFTLHTTRERQQRWLVNQRQAAHVLQGLEMKTKDDVPALVAWAHYMVEHSDGWVKRAASEALTCT
jgi:hypothetical protein